MKDLINKGKTADESSANAEVAAFRALVSNNFDNSPTLLDTDTWKASAPDATNDHVETPGRAEVGVDNAAYTERSEDAQRSNLHLSPEQVEPLVASALRTLADTSDQTPGEAPLAQLFALTEAYLSFDETARHEMLARIMQDGVSANDVIKEVVPATARYMGELWATDKLSFAEVTIGAARLQETVRNIGGRQPYRAHPAPDGPTIMLVVPRFEQHTLGIFVVAEQFRRMGACVHITLGNNQAEILRLVRTHHFAMIGVTASCRRSLASVQDLVKTVRTGVPRITPIVVGGPVTDLGLDIISMTGADYVADNAEEALRLCGIETTQKIRHES